MQKELSTKIDQLMEHIEAQVDATNELKKSLERYKQWLEDQAKELKNVVE